MKPEREAMSKRELKQDLRTQIEKSFQVFAQTEEQRDTDENLARR